MRFLSLILPCLLCLNASAQNFEGTIEYKNDFKSKNPNVSSETLNATMGTAQEYSIMGAAYKSTFKGAGTEWQIYNPKDNNLYYKFSTWPTVYKTTAKAKSDVVLSAVINKNATTILSESCDELILTCKSGVKKYYFSSKYSVDPKKFADHLFENWYEYVKRAKALPLKMIIETAQYVLTSTATKITAKTLSDSIFTIPANAKIAELPL